MISAEMKAAILELPRIDDNNEKCILLREFAASIEPNFDDLEDSEDPISLEIATERVRLAFVKIMEKAEELEMTDAELIAVFAFSNAEF